MPVLVESNSVIVCRDSIDARMQGGWDEFLRLAPAATLCTDGEIVRVGFDEFEAMVEFLRALQGRGLRYGVSPSEDDIATYRLEVGPDGPKSKQSPCDRIVYAFYLWTESGWRIISAVLKDGQAARDRVAVPPGWDYEQSQSRVLRVKARAADE